MLHKINAVAAEKDSGRRIDSFICERVPLSRKEVQRQFDGVRLNDKPARKNYLLRAGDIVTARFLENDSEVKPAKGRLEIIYEDEHLIAVNKPAGLLTHPPQKNRSEVSLLSLLLGSGRALARSTDAAKQGVVHRLDRETSGIVIFTKTSIAFESLSSQFRNRKVQKTYIARVHGCPSKGLSTISAPLRPLKKSWKMKVDPEGKESITKIKLLRKSTGESILMCLPLTGRSHQIRAHLAHIGNPIIGDTKYHPGCARCAGSRLLLHAHKIRFSFPTKGGTVELSCEIPQEFLNYPPSPASARFLPSS